MSLGFNKPNSSTRGTRDAARDRGGDRETNSATTSSIPQGDANANGKRPRQDDTEHIGPQCKKPRQKNIATEVATEANEHGHDDADSTERGDGAATALKLGRLSSNELGHQEANTGTIQAMQPSPIPSTLVVSVDQSTSNTASQQASPIAGTSDDARDRGGDEEINGVTSTPQGGANAQRPSPSCQIVDQETEPPGNDVGPSTSVVSVNLSTSNTPSQEVSPIARTSDDVSAPDGDGQMDGVISTEAFRFMPDS
jgi:hypothetical protein